MRLCVCVFVCVFQASISLSIDLQNQFTCGPLSFWFAPSLLMFVCFVVPCVSLDELASILGSSKETLLWSKMDKKSH